MHPAVNSDVTPLDSQLIEKRLASLAGTGKMTSNAYLNCSLGSPLSIHE
jgi:hypothetical protein